MSASTEQFQRQFFCGFLRNDDQLQCDDSLASAVQPTASAGFGARAASKIRMSAENFLARGKRLRQGFGLSDDSNVVFQREDLAQPSAENGLRVGHDHPNELPVRTITLLRQFERSRPR